jgi:hypothetical protein
MKELEISRISEKIIYEYSGTMRTYDGDEEKLTDTIPWKDFHTYVLVAKIRNDVNLENLKKDIRNELKDIYKFNTDYENYTDYEKTAIVMLPKVIGHKYENILKDKKERKTRKIPNFSLS